jgi:L,D-transpeptidase YcbB
MPLNLARTLVGTVAAGAVVAVSLASLAGRYPSAERGAEAGGGGGGGWRGRPEPRPPLPPPSGPPRLTGGEATPLEAGGRPLRSPAAVRRFYETRGFALAWSTESGVGAEAQPLIDAVAGAGAEGLDPHAYHLEALRRESARAAAAGGRRLEPRLRAELDLLLSDAFLTLAGHLAAGRVEPRRVHPSWTLPERPAEPVASLERALAGEGVARVLGELRPRAPEYPALRDALARYRARVEEGGWAAIPAGRTLRTGDRDERVGLLRRRLEAEGFLPGDPGSAGSAGPVDADLEAAVRRFQRLRGLEEDGAVGPGTLAALNVPADRRLAQLELALERLRWLPDDLGERHVRVDLPGFRMELVEDGRVVLAMRVIGGQPTRWRTPVFSGTMNAVVLSPYWNIPPSIAADEVIPAFRRDPQHLARNEIRVLTGAGAQEREVSPRAVDWTRASAAGSPYRLRQDPGPRNPLGGVKFVFPNRHNVYLHDTPNRTLFERADRALSHGCIRLERPLDLAEHLLGSQPGWTRERIVSTIAARREVRVALARPVPVHILYRTAWIAEEGELHFRDDLYGHDRTLESALRDWVGGAAPGPAPAGRAEPDPDAARPA